jgi:hypothetical protein
MAPPIDFACEIDSFLGRQESDRIPIVRFSNLKHDCRRE